MSLLDDLNACNALPVLDSHSDAFRTYGRFVEGYDLAGEMKLLNELPVPEEGNAYVPSVKEMEDLPVKQEIQNCLYGGMPVQIGYCNGRNSTVNGFEYHKGSEINAAGTDLVLALGHVWDIHDLHYDLKDVKLFLFKKGDVFELYQTTLHLSPMKVDDRGYRTLVILPAGTNTDPEDKKESRDPESRLLLKKNKWVVAHPDRKQLTSQGAYPGVIGENYELKY